MATEVTGQGRHHSYGGVWRLYPACRVDHNLLRQLHDQLHHTPVVEVPERHIGVRKAILTTIHAYTASPSLVDGPRNRWRRGRAAAVSFVPTSTWAARATTRILPDLAGRFDGIAVRLTS